MIELQVIAVKKEGLATEYRLSPDPVIIGAMDSHNEEKLHLALPEEWEGRPVRVTFTPDMCEGVGFIADNDGCVPITAAFSGAAPRGVITVEAFEAENETVTRKTFARDVRYRAIPHAAPGEPPEDITPTQFEQFVANVADRAADAQSAAQDADEYSRSAWDSEQSAYGYARTAQECAIAAAESEKKAESYMDDAETYANAAGTARNEANTAAEQAKASAGTASSGAAAAVNAQSLAQQAQSKAEVAGAAAASSAQKAADSEFAATNAAGTLMSVADDTANAIVLEASGSVVQIAAASRTLKELLVNVDPTLDGRTGTMVTVATDDVEMSYAVDFGKVVYGGIYNWKTRELTETWQAFVFDGSEGWTLAGGETDSLLPAVFKGDALNIARKNTAICNRYDRSTADGTVGQFWIDERTSTDYNVRFMCDKAVAADITAWKAYLKAQHDAGTPVVLVAEVVEPITAALAATEMPRSVAPSCSIAATTGDVSLAYVADTKAYVDENSGEGSTAELVKIVTELPAEGVENKTYFVAKTDGSGMDLYDEYMWINGAWEYIGTKQIEIDLAEYVKRTDYATDSKCGLVKVSNYRGMKMLTGGIITLMAPADTQIDTRNNGGDVAATTAVTLSKFDHTLKAGLTANAETLTDEEKSAAQEWLGVTPALTTFYAVYGKTPFADVLAAHKAGKSVFMVKGNNVAPFAGFEGSGETQMLFHTQAYNYAYTFSVKDTDVWSMTTRRMVPTASASDDGKFLRVVNGAPAWVELTDVSEVGA